MNNIYTLPKLVDLLSKAAGIDAETAQRWVIDFTDLIAEGLAADNNVRIKGLGAFTRVDVGGKVSVKFEPERELSDQINAPFMFFEPTELADQVTADMLAGIKPGSGHEDAPNPDNREQQIAADEHQEMSQPTDAATFDQTMPTDEAVSPTEANPASAETNDTHHDEAPHDEAPQDEVPQPRTMPMPPTIKITEAEQPVSPTPPVYTRDDDYDNDDNYPQKTNLWFWLSVTFIIGLLIGFGVGYFCHDPISARTYSDAQERFADDALPVEELMLGDTEKIDVDTIPSPAEDAVEATTPVEVAPEPVVAEPVKEAPKPEAAKPQAQAPTQPESAGPVYEVVSPKLTLTSMARKHYGHPAYWVYIYMENRDKISNPNNVKEGLKLVIPPKSKYDVSKNESENINAAKNKAAEVQAKYAK